MTCCIREERWPTFNRYPPLFGAAATPRRSSPFLPRSLPGRGRPGSKTGPRTKLRPSLAAALFHPRRRTALNLPVVRKIPALRRTHGIGPASVAVFQKNTRSIGCVHQRQLGSIGGQSRISVDESLFGKPQEPGYGGHVVRRQQDMARPSATGSALAAQEVCAICFV